MLSNIISLFLININQLFGPGLSYFHIALQYRNLKVFESLLKAFPRPSFNPFLYLDLTDKFDEWSLNISQLVK